jgi:hypothetical protein
MYSLSAGYPVIEDSCELESRTGQDFYIDMQYKVRFDVNIICNIISYVLKDSVYFNLIYSRLVTSKILIIGNLGVRRLVKDSFSCSGTYGSEKTIRFGIIWTYNIF